MPDTIQERASAWLSEGVECLVQRLGEKPRDGVDFDAIVVGSGYGGAIAASTLAGRAKADGGAFSVCVLERGREYLPGAFPGRMASLAGHTRLSGQGKHGVRGEREGLFDIKPGDDVSALVANGLGGGSLINAGVMAEPPAAVRAMLETATGPLESYYQRARVLLGADRNTILDHESGSPPLKYTALKSLAHRLGRGRAFEPAPITVAMRKHQNSAGVGLDACIGCGDCATGCNFNAKESLDTNLLVTARRRGAALYTGATVVRIERDAQQDRWRLHAVYTDAALDKRMPAGFVLYASKVILAAGTYGSTEILLRSRSKQLDFSPMLGQKFSSNGDMIAVAYGQEQEANAVADEAVSPHARKVGPTITGMIRVPAGQGQAEGDMLVEELAVPGPMRRMFEEIVATTHTLHGLASHDSTVHSQADQAHDPCAIDGAAMRRSSVLAVMGDDGAAGRMELSSGAGGIRVRWPELRHHPLFERQAALLAEGGLGPHGNPKENGAILPNPMWKLLPDSLGYLLKGRRGPLLTVHPLGGCPIGASAASGAVNANGQVFAASGELHAGLVVLDGAIVPGALAVNPALTISALALRAAENLCAEWQLGAPPALAALAPRPVFRIMPAPGEVQPSVKPTMAGFVERMSGQAILRDRHGVPAEYRIELTMHFDPAALAGMILPEGQAPVPLRRSLRVGADSRVEVFLLSDWKEWNARRESRPEPGPALQMCAKLSGTLDFFHREQSIHPQRVARTLGPWLRNRGLRDTWQWMFGEEGKDKDAGQGQAQESGLERLRSALALASRGGEVRRFDYALTMHEASAPGRRFDPAILEGARIAGEKRLTYGYASNPWSQLMRMTLTRFPGFAPLARNPAVLELDTGFLVRQGAPLMRIVSQHDQPTALADVAGLAGYVLRLLLSIHMWSFRKPDAPARRTPQRLPGPLPGLRMDILHLPFPDLPGGKKVAARLTRYRGASTGSAPPVLMIHGYSASGTTFAHEVVNPNLASYMCARGRDVWVLDMRTSSGMPTATHPWQFEDAAHNDIPLAVARVCGETGHEKIDVVAHCMGAAMFAMAVLGEPAPGAPFESERRALPGRVNSLLLSQVGPLVVFSQANIFRAYLMGYVRYLMPEVSFPFTPTGKPSMADELIDRVLSTIPYPDEEFRIENPALPWRRTGFTGTRHRMDALYGRDFQLANIDAAVLDRIDDFFGPYSLVTLNQAIHFARLKTITNRAGRNPYVSRENLAARWTFPTHCVHGVENGLSDVATLDRMQGILRDAGCRITVQAFEGFGHQDCFIGRGAVRVFEDIARFQAEAGRAAAAPPARTPAANDAAMAPPRAGKPRHAAMAGAVAAALAETDIAPVATPDAGAAERELIVRPPWTGPLRTFLPPHPLTQEESWGIGAAAGPILHQALRVIFVQVVERAGRYLPAGGGAPDPAVLRGCSEVFCNTSAVLDADGWVQLAATPCPAGADGLLMFMVFNAAETLDAPPPAAGPRLKMAPFSDMMLSAEGPPPETPWQSDPHVWDGSIGTRLAAAIARELAAKSSAELACAFIPAASRAAPPPGTRPSAAGAPAPAKATPRQVCFAVASCQYPAGLLDSEPAFASYRRLAARLDSGDPLPKPSFIALLGDQIYADPSAGLFDPSERDDRYVRPYEKLLGNAYVQSVLRRLPALMMLDDHEIEDNWEAGGARAGKEAQEDLKAGVDAYFKFQRNGALGGIAGGGFGTPLDFEHEAGGLPFYFADTRTGRDARTPHNIATAHIMQPAQFERLTNWLLAQHERVPDVPKFLATPSIVAPRRLGPAGKPNAAHALRADGWNGYPASLHRLLAFIADHGIANVVLLSGDEHISCDAKIRVSTPAGAQCLIRSIHSSALYAPYPFANSCKDDMAGDIDRFSFRREGVEGEYACEVETSYAGGDGFAIVTATQVGKAWKIDCAFDRAS